jgi:4-amino-4-deoxy-L-arabinose transferase-like glycosyltransferase
LLGFLLARLLLALITLAEPEGGVLTDSQGYIGLGLRLVEQGAYYVPPNSEPDLLRPPGYPLFLVGIWSVFGQQPFFVVLIQLAISGLTAWLVLLLGRELNQPAAGLVGAWLYALSPNVILWSLMLMTEVLAAFLLVATILITLRLERKASRGWPALTGGLLGLSAYVRPISLTLLPVWGLVTYLIIRRKAGGRPALRAALLLLAGGGLVVVPWVARNWFTHGQATFSTVTQKTWIGFNLASVLAQAQDTTRDRAVAQLDSEKGLLRLTVEVIQRYPTDFVTGQLLGITRILLGNDIGTWGHAFGHRSWVGSGIISGLFRDGLSQSLEAARDSLGDPQAAARLALIGISVLYSLVLLGLAAAGLLDRRAPVSDGLAAWLIIGSLIVLILLPGAAGQARFRVPAEPLLAWFAGLGWTRALGRS